MIPRNSPQNYSYTLIVFKFKEGLAYARALHCNVEHGTLAQLTDRFNMWASLRNHLGQRQYAPAIFAQRIHTR